MKNSVRTFKKDMLVIVKDNDSAIAKLSVFGEIVSKEERGKVIFWNNNPGDGVYVVTGYLYDNPTSIHLAPKKIVRINQLEKIEEELANYNFVLGFMLTFPRFLEGSRFQIQKENISELKSSVEKAGREINLMGIEDSVKDSLLEMVCAKISTSENLSTKVKVSIIQPVIERRKARCLC